ncbi:MAG: winged helix-turn-helix transcriptional regulator [Myxococcales bacterium]|nr:winged helix-turn-helix transcriptional regulator [Myxococcales bacterium]
MAEMTDQAPRTSLIDDAERARLALSPLRRRLLEALRTPGSAASLAAELGLPRQRIGYHLRALEAAGLIRLVEARQRRGFVERRFVAEAASFVIDPALLGHDPSVDAQDRFAAEHLVRVAADVVREVTRMRAAAEAADQRLLTFTIEADVGFERPQDLEDFARALTDTVADLASRYRADGAGRRYRLVIGAHPAVAGRAAPTPQ